MSTTATTIIIVTWLILTGVTGAALCRAGYWRHAARRLGAALHAATDAARRDPLTGLGNRAGFLHTIAGARPGALILLNLDATTGCRELLGDRLFDQLLVILAGRLTHGAEVTAGRVFRLRRDEFAVLTEQPPEPLAARLLAAIAEPADLRHPLEVTVSVTACAGVVHRPAARTALRHADAALRTAKRGGPGRTVVFAPGPRQADGR